MLVYFDNINGLHEIEERFLSDYKSLGYSCGYIILKKEE